MNEVQLICDVKIRIWETKNPVKPDKTVSPVKVDRCPVSCPEAE